jgi:hypothetical protein
LTSPFEIDSIVINLGLKALLIEHFWTEKLSTYGATDV